MNHLVASDHLSHERTSSFARRERMPFPMPGVTFGDFLQSIKSSRGVVEKTLPNPLVGPRGEVPVIWLEREADGRIYQVPLPEMDDDETLDPDMMDHLCRRLGLSSREFGYDIGNPPWYADKT